MEFTEAEAQAKKGKRVRVYDNFLANYGIPQGTVGQVVDALPLRGRATGAGLGRSLSQQRDGWVVDVKFYRPNHHPLSLLLEKDEYENSLEEF